MNMGIVKKIVFILLVGILFINSNSNVNAENYEIINNVSRLSNGIFVTMGVKAEFENSINNDEDIGKIIKKLKEKFTVEEEVKKQTCYSVSFKSKDIVGYIERTKNVNKNRYIICIEKNSNKNYLMELQRMILNITSKNEKDLKLSMYIKSKLINSDIGKVNEEIIQKLKHESINRIDTVKYNNGYSNIVYIQNGNEKNSVNFIVCKYDSGNYLIVGTPEVFAEF